MAPGSPAPPASPSSAPASSGIVPPPDPSRVGPDNCRRSRRAARSGPEGGHERAMRRGVRRYARDVRPSRDARTPELRLRRSVGVHRAHRARGGRARRRGRVRLPLDAARDLLTPGGTHRQVARRRGDARVRGQRATPRRGPRDAPRGRRRPDGTDRHPLGRHVGRRDPPRGRRLHRPSRERRRASVRSGVGRPAAGGTLGAGRPPQMGGGGRHRRGHAARCGAHHAALRCWACAPSPGRPCPTPSAGSR